MEVFVLADVDYEDFVIIGVYGSLEGAKWAASNAKLQGRSFWIDKHKLDEGGLGSTLLKSRDGKTWEEKS